MIKLKSQKDIEILHEGGKHLSRILTTLRDKVSAGIFTDELDKLARDLIKEVGGKPAFLGYHTHGRAYPAALCASINENIVHAPASIRREIKEGDVVSLDIGLIYKDLYTDMATTVIVGEPINMRVKKLLSVTKKALEEGIKECIVGESLLKIGKRIEYIARAAGFGVVRELVGHGVGYKVHEEPIVPNFADNSVKNIKMEEGLVIAIEPMFTLDEAAIEIAEDNWAYKSKDRSIAAHFEATVAITKDGPVIITPIV